MRIYNNQLDQAAVDDQAIQADAVALQLQALGIRSYFSVWRDDAQPDSDSGLMLKALNRRFSGQKGIHVREHGGDLFVDALNKPMQHLEYFGYTHVLVLSTTAAHLITQAVLEAAKTAFVEKGAEIVGIVHPDFPKLVRAGFITNTACFYYLKALKRNEWLHNIDRRPVKFNPNIHKAGVCEAYNVIRFTETAGRLILAIVDSGLRKGDSRTDERHNIKLDTKEKRINKMLFAKGLTPDRFRSCIIPGYPITVST